MEKKQKQRYRDGICFVLEEIPEYSDFNAKKNAKKFKKIVKLNFDYRSLRIKDIEMENIIDTKFELKIVTPFYDVTSDGNLFILVFGRNGVKKVYKIEYVDKTREECFFFLSKLGDDKVVIE